MTLFNVFAQCSFLQNCPGGAAVIGNIAVETGNSFAYNQKQKGGGPGYGLFQMEKMKVDYDIWREKDQATPLPDSAGAQLNYAIVLIDTGRQIGAGNAKKIREVFNSGDVSKAAEVFCNIFEKPNKEKSHMVRRIEAAKQAANARNCIESSVCQSLALPSTPSLMQPEQQQVVAPPSHTISYRPYRRNNHGISLAFGVMGALGCAFAGSSSGGFSARASFTLNF